MTEVFFRPFLLMTESSALIYQNAKKNLSKTLSPTKNHETRAYTYMTIHIGVAARRRRASLCHPDINSHIGMLPYLVVFCEGTEDEIKRFYADPGGFL